MDLKARMDIVLKNYKRLGYMNMALKELQTSYISDPSTFGVQLSQMSLHPDTTDSGPRFCTPFPAHEFDLLFDRAEKQSWDTPTLDFNGNFL